MILLAFKVKKLLNIRQKLPDQKSFTNFNRGYIYCQLQLQANNMTMLYPNTELDKSRWKPRTTKGTDYGVFPP